MKKFVALARVSSREQEREGFSLAVQEAALRHYVEKVGGEIVRLFRIAETASKTDERKAFRELVAYAKKHAFELDGLLFYKVDRAARNLFDYVELERLESEYGVPFISVSQPTDDNPAGRMMRRTLANMASFYTEQQSVDVREGLARRVQEGWFISKAPYGYRNLRQEGRSIVEICPDAGPKVRRVFHLFAYENLTLDSLIERLEREGITYRPTCAKFARSSLHSMLHDRSYIGEVQYHGQWYPGKHEPLVDHVTWSRVQELIGGHFYRSHELTYGGELIKCGYCGYPITGERKFKQSSTGERAYTYYRCAKYNRPGHPRTRVREEALDQQVLALFDKIRIQDDSVRDWFRAVLASQTRDQQHETRSQREELQRQVTMTLGQQARVVNLRVDGEIDAETFATKQVELRDRLAALKLQMDAVDRSNDEMADLVSKVFELSQTLREKWLTADYHCKRRILEIICLNFRLDDVTLCYEMRKPFDVLVEGLPVQWSRGERI